MQDTITGLDKYKLTMLAKEYGIDLPVYDVLLNLYDQAMLKNFKEKK